MNLRSRIKQTLNEVAGISFEVREWASILNKEIDRLVKQADDELSANSTDDDSQSEVHTTQYDEDDEYDDISHFEDTVGDMYDEAVVHGDELMYSAETVKDHPEITGLIKGKIIRISLETYGLRVIVDGIDSKYEEVLEDMVFDHADWSQPFYDYNTHNELMGVFTSDLPDAVSTGNSGYSSQSSGWGNWFGGGSWKQTPRADIQELIIDGKDFPEAYEKFSVDKWIFKQAGRIEYDHYNSGYNEETGDYEVYFNVPIRGLGLNMFIHETKHAYDDWNRMRHGGKAIRDSWEIKNIYTKDFEKLVLGGSAQFPRLGHIVRMYYLGSKLETPAYLENEFDAPHLKSYRDTGVKLRDFSIDLFFNKKGKPVKGLEEEFVNMLINYDIPYFRKFKDVRSFLEKTKKYFNKRGDDIVRRIDKTMYVHGKVTDSTPPTKWKSPFKPNKGNNPHGS